MTVSLPMSTDRDVLTVPEAARLSGVERHEFTRWLRDEKFNAAVVIKTPGTRVRISRPRLLRYLHGDTTATLADQRGRYWGGDGPTDDSVAAPSIEATR